MLIEEVEQGRLGLDGGQPSGQAKGIGVVRCDFGVERDVLLVDVASLFGSLDRSEERDAIDLDRADADEIAHPGKPVDSVIEFVAVDLRFGDHAVVPARHARRLDKGQLGARVDPMQVLCVFAAVRLEGMGLPEPDPPGLVLDGADGAADSVDQPADPIDRPWPRALVEDGVVDRRYGGGKVGSPDHLRSPPPGPDRRARRVIFAA